VSLYKRGDVWWYKFSFNGQLIRESSKSDSKTLAKGAEHARRRELEQAYNHIPKRQRMPLFSHAAELWLASKAGLAQRSRERYEQCAEHLKAEYGKGLVCDVDANDVAEYRRKRLAAGVSNRTVNYETGTLRGILRQFGLWGPIADRVKALPERHDVGRAIPPEEETKLLAAASPGSSPSRCDLTRYRNAVGGVTGAPSKGFVSRLEGRSNSTRRNNRAEEQDSGRYWPRDSALPPCVRLPFTVAGTICRSRV
jgi:hypothetical protein